MNITKEQLSSMLTDAFRKGEFYIAEDADWIVGHDEVEDKRIAGMIDELTEKYGFNSSSEFLDEPYMDGVK